MAMLVEIWRLITQRVGGAVTLCLVRWAPDRAIWVRARAGHCTVFLGKTLYSHTASLHPGV